MKTIANCKDRFCRKKYVKGHGFVNHLNNRGELTVMICLFMSILLLFMLACSEAVHISLGKSRAATAVVSANESVMADYNRFLWENYHIFAVDETYGGTEVTALNQKVTSYLELNLGEQKGIYQYSTPSAFIENRIYLAQDLEIIKNQIREYMKYQVGEDMVKDAWEILSNTNQEESVDAVKKDVEAADQRAKLAEQESEQVDSDGTNGTKDVSSSNAVEVDKENGINDKENPQDSDETKKVEDPRKTLKKILKTGVVELVTNRTDISRESYEIREFKELVPSTVSNSQEYKNTTDVSENDTTGAGSQVGNSIGDMQNNSNSISFEDAKDVTGRLEDCKVSTSYTEEAITQVLTFQYMNDTFSSVRSNVKHVGNHDESKSDLNSIIECQMEYLIAGKDNDYDNVHSVIDRMIALRFVSNYVAVVKMPDKVAEANSVAMSIAGATANPAIVELVCYLLLACESYAESVLDVKALVAGEKVPAIKTQLNWKIGLLSFAKDFAKSYTKNNIDTKLDASSGLRYEDYLTMLLLAQTNPDVKYKRMLQLMDACGRKDREDFAMEHMLFGFRSNVEVEIVPKFSGITKRIGGYQYHLKKYISY